MIWSSYQSFLFCAVCVSVSHNSLRGRGDTGVCGVGGEQGSMLSPPESACQIGDPINVTGIPPKSRLCEARRREELRPDSEEKPPSSLLPCMLGPDGLLAMIFALKHYLL